MGFWRKLKKKEQNGGRKQNRKREKLRKKGRV